MRLFAETASGNGLCKFVSEMAVLARFDCSSLRLEHSQLNFIVYMQRFVYCEREST